VADFSVTNKLASLLSPLGAAWLWAAALVSPVGANPPPGLAPHAGNPILPGYFADPALVQHAGTNYLYATIDPWGGETLGCWESADFRQWTYRELNWPTKRACTSPTSKAAKVWAPSVVRTPSGQFFMYVSVGNEVWVGTAAHPLGPWRDANGGRPLIPENFRPGYHMIDAEAFVDDDGAAYLYWGSGWNWVNGKCWVVKLQPDMISFDGEVRDITPARYFEAPFMLKHAGRYYLMYSSGKTIEDSYQVHYATGATPIGPFTEAANSPILTTARAQNIRAPGHHAVFEQGGRHYILYHRHSIPFDPEFIGRQTCVDEMTFTRDGGIAPVQPTHGGPALVQRAWTTRGFKAAASHARSATTSAGQVLDDNYATLWAAGIHPEGAWLQLDLGEVRRFERQELRFEYPWKRYRFTVESSNDGQQWSRLADYTVTTVSGSPVIIAATGRARYLRLVFPAYPDAPEPALFEWNVR
jgi:beta-xylosidase